MKILLKILGGLAVLVLVLVVGSFFMPKTYHVERAIVIQAKPEAVFPLLADLRQWSTWGVWYERDPVMTITYSPVTTGVGAFSDWKSKSQGNGKATVTAVVPLKSVTYTLEFPDNGMTGVGRLAMGATEGGSLRVVSSMDGELGINPMMRLMGPFLGKMIGPDFEAGLAKVKRIAEGGAK
jgi:uncharacterized protein YndB with AHSA1/START domain